MYLTPSLIVAQYYFSLLQCNSCYIHFSYRKCNRQCLITSNVYNLLVVLSGSSPYMLVLSPCI